MENWKLPGRVQKYDRHLLEFMLVNAYVSDSFTTNMFGLKLPFITIVVYLLVITFPS
jgi:hypothetical protein